jgi:hypothetical protein
VLSLGENPNRIVNMVYGYLCGVPKANCSGTLAKLSAGLDKQGLKKHGTQQEAFSCYCRYLKSQGYAQISAREFQKPGEPIMSLSKVAKFGARLRSGKTGDTGQGNSRGMGAVNHGGVVVCN